MDLAAASLAPSTISVYTKSATKFYQWLVHHNYSPSSHIQLDQHLSLYLHELYISGMGKAIATSTLFGLNIAQPGITDHLPSSRKALRGYQRLVPSIQHPPLTWPITCVIALEMIRRGYFNEGIITLLAFDSYLRINEALGLYREDCAIGADVRIGAGRPDRLYLRLRRTKTGNEQGVEVLNDEVKLLVIMVRERTPPFAKMFPCTDDYYRRLFRRVCDDLQLPSDYVPHSLRHGGATFGYLTDLPFADIMVRGSWASLKSATHYVQSCRQALLTRTIPPLVAAAADIIMKHTIIDCIRSVLKSTASR